MSARMTTVLIQFKQIFLWVFVFYVCVAVKNGITSQKTGFGELDKQVENGAEEKVPLKCEETWNQVMKARERKFTSLINPTHLLVNEFLEIVTSNKTVCDGILESSENSDGNDRLAIVLVNSERRNFNKRKIIRETWGSMRKYNGWEIRTVFLLGQSNFCLNMSQGVEARKKAKVEEEKISNEVEKYGDLILGSFTDSLKNKTYKHLTGYKFVLESCPQAELIIKTEDNIFLNLPQVLKTRRENLDYDMFCKISKNLWPVRCSKCENGKYFVSEKEWRSDRYPQYCEGNLLAVSRDWAEDLYGARGLAGFFWIEEVFVMGLLKEAAEKEFGREVKTYNFGEMVKTREGGDMKWAKQLCKNVDQKNLEGKRKELGIYEKVEGEKGGKWMECFWNIVLGSNLPFSLK